MKGIKRFQRTMIVLLVGINILVFSSSFHGDLGAAFGHAIIGMGTASVLLLCYGLIRKGIAKKKSTEGILHSREN